MSLTGFEFYFFAAIVVLLYYVLPKRCQRYVLLVASIVFYCTYGTEKLPFMLASAVIAYIASARISAIQEKTENAAEAKMQSKPVLLLATLGLVVLLLYAKIGTWVMSSVASLLPLKADSVPTAIVALGVSYYTFSLISYIADVYWRKDKAEKNFLNLLLFTAYFPKILEGPISRHKTLAPQFTQPHLFDYKEFCFGLQLMVWGYFKKMVIADRLSILINTVYGKPSSYSGSILLFAAIISCVQVYCDFSGCMDIIGGFSQILGLKLESNFDHPFFSRSAAEFWRRWHMTLGVWFKDYVYMPLMISPRLIGFSKKLKDRFGMRASKAFMTVVPLTAVWLLTGLWHGTGLDYVVWGVYWGVLIICSNVFAPEIKKLSKLLHINTSAKSWSAFQTVRTFLLFTVSRLIVLPGNLAVTASIFRSIFTDFSVASLVDGTLYTLGLDRPNFILAVVCVLILWGMSKLQLQGSVRQKIADCNIVFRWAIYYAAIFSIIIFGIYGPGYDASSFVYMRF